MFGRKKKKNDNNAQLAQQLGISLPGMDGTESTPVDESDEMLEAELLALMEEDDDDDYVPPDNGGPSSAEAASAEENNANELLAELAELESQDDVVEPVQPVRPTPADVHPPVGPVSVEQTQRRMSPPVTQPRMSPPATQKPVETPVPIPRKMAPPIPDKAPAPPNIADQDVDRLVAADKPDRLVASVPKQPMGHQDMLQLIEGRLRNYEDALKNAREKQEVSKARRYERGIQSLKDIEKKTRAGRIIAESDIPPEVATGHPSVQSNPERPTEQTDNNTSGPDTYKLLCQRRDLYKMAVGKSKKEGDTATAMEHLKIVKQFEMVIEALQGGEQIDLTHMPPPPSHMKAPQQSQPRTEPPGGGGNTSLVSSMPQPRTNLEALAQRRNEYKQLGNTAAGENNSGKVRRLGRIVKQYEDAMKKEKAGRPVAYHELPELPYFPPFPANKPAHSEGTQQIPQATPTAQTQDLLTPGVGGRTELMEVVPVPADSQPSPPRKSVKEAMNERQLRVLTEKKKKTMLLALQAKKQGDMEEAKRLIIISKGFDPMIEAASQGLPVNMDSIPKLPEEDRQTVVSPPVELSEGDVDVFTGDKNDMYSRLISTLQNQMEKCRMLSEAYEELGNTDTAKRFMEYFQCSQDDKDILMVAHQHNDPVPRFHFEQRTIPTIRITPGLKKNEAEIVIIRGLNFKHPAGGGNNDLDTYVKFEFPYPTDQPQTGQTDSAKGMESVEYKSSHRIQINSKARSFLSMVKRKQLKFEVMHRRGLLRADKSMGVASLKLADLEKKHELHESVPLIEGRREVGGKLEVKICIHHPLSGLKEEYMKEKWLVVESKTSRLDKNVPKTSQQVKSSPVKPNPSSKIPIPEDTIYVLKWEIIELQKRITAIQSQRKKVPPELLTKNKQLMKKVKDLEGGLSNKYFEQAYFKRLHSNLSSYNKLQKQAVDMGDKEKAKVFLIKKELVGKELLQRGPVR